MSNRVGGMLEPQRISTGSSIISERLVEKEVRRPKRVVREQVVEKVIVVPQKVVKEEVVEEVQTVTEKIIEIAKPVIEEKIVEVPEYEYIEKIVTVPQIEYVERIKHVPRVEVQEKIVHVPKIVTQEKIVEVPEIEYREYEVEKVIEVPEIREEVVIREVPVPQYVDRPYNEYVNVEVPQDIERNIPVPVEATTTFEFQLSQLRPVYTRKELPIYAPRFVEVPVPAELMDEALQKQALQLQEQIHRLAAQSAPSLCEIEKIAEFARNNDFQEHISTSNFQNSIERAWKAGTLKIQQGGSMNNMMFKKQSSIPHPMTSSSTSHKKSSKSRPSKKSSSRRH